MSIECQNNKLLDEQKKLVALTVKVNEEDKQIKKDKSIVENSNKTEV